jgi:hypothetical protein
MPLLFSEDYVYQGGELFDVSAHESVDGNIVIPITLDDCGNPKTFIKLSSREALELADALEKAVIDVKNTIDLSLKERRTKQQ